MIKNQTIIKMTFSAIFLALSYVLPFLTGQIPEIGSMLCPLHIPILLCGFICGWKWGLIIGLIAPILRSLTLGMPPLFPTAIAMAFELGMYGLISGLMYKLLPKKPIYIYCSLLISMIVGRIIWGIAMFICMSASGGIFTFDLFLTGAFINAIPGIIIQINLIPILVILFKKLNIIKI